jgi:hypothetical protein
LQEGHENAVRVADLENPGSPGGVLHRRGPDCNFVSGSFDVLDFDGHVEPVAGLAE